MVTVLKKGTKKRNLALLYKKVLEELKTQGFNAKYYCGKLSLKKDPLLIQKELRDEWN